MYGGARLLAVGTMPDVFVYVGQRVAVHPCACAASRLQVSERRDHVDVDGSNCVRTTLLVMLVS